jgi:hypothetical protein
VVRFATALALALLAGLPAAALDAEISYWAVQAVEENRAEKSYGEGLAGVRPELSDLPHDTFTLLADGGLGANFGNRAEAKLTEKYRLRIEPVDHDPDGRVRIRVIVKYETAPGKLVDAIDTRVVLTPGKVVRLGGLKLEEGDLVILFSAD